MLSAFDAKTGTHSQQRRLLKPYQFKASPVGANGKLISPRRARTDRRPGKADIRGPGHQDVQGQTFIASPAIIDGEIYLRGQNTLFAIR